MDVGIQVVIGNSKMSTSQPYDVAIIGGGLAGLTFAIQMRKVGLHVLLCEKETYPFHKVCGEYIIQHEFATYYQLNYFCSQWQYIITQA
jgi:heterodisulfide reductase subunit A-like polyferredoxin